jgi:serine/threonine protein kinase/WD40 repeat protein
MSETSPGSGRDPVEQLLESFLARWRSGERPSLEEYAARCPERAGEIRELFRALVEMEQLKPGVEAATGPVEQASPRPEPAAGPVPPHPERLGDYHILRVIGEGGMGVVYQAEHESLKNWVALKVMHPRFRTERTYLRRFQTEAGSAARLHHTNIVPVFDFGEQGGICYYAMQYITGVGLNDVLDDVRRLRDPAGGGSSVGTGGKGDDQPTSSVDAPLPAVTHGLLTGRFATPPANPGGSDRSPGAALDSSRTDSVPAAVVPDLGRPSVVRAAGSGDPGQTDGSSSIAGRPESLYFREIARLGAQVADALDYAHRQNVVHRDIKPSNLMLDAQGNVWVTDFCLAKLVEGEDLSGSHDLVGTLRFMAPERFRGVTDRRGDIYALGATLYELLALRPAFAERDQVLLIDQIARQAPAPLRQHDRRIPRDLETIVHKVLAKDPKDRCDQAGELRDELRRFLDGRPTRWRRVGPVEQFRRWCKRNPVIAGLNALAATLTILIAIVSTVAAYRNGRLATQLETRNIEANQNLDKARDAERKSRLALGHSRASEGAALQRTGLQGQRFSSLDRLEQAALLLGEQPEGRASLPKLRDQAITAMGLTDLRLISQRDIGEVMAIACDPTLERYATTELLAKKSADGQTIVRSMADDRELFRVPRPGPSYRRAWPEFSPGGQFLAVSYTRDGGEHQIHVWQLDRKKLIFRQQSRRVERIFHPDGRRLIFRPTAKELAVWDLIEGRETKRLPLAFAPAYFCLDHDGRRIAVNAAGDSRKVKIIELETGRGLTTWVENVGGLSISWSGDDRLLAIENNDGRIFVWDVERNSLASVFHDRNWAADHLEFSPIGHFLATHTAGSTRLWNALSGELLVTAPFRTPVRLSTDGRRMALIDGPRLGIWEVTHDQELVTLNPGLIGNRTWGTGLGEIRAARFSPDGRLVAVATAEGTYLYDGHGGRELAKLKTGSPGNTDTVLFDREGRYLMTYSESGLFRWPIRDAPVSGSDALQIGPPMLIRERLSWSREKASWLPDGRTLAMVEHDEQRVLLVDTQDPHPARKRVRALSSSDSSRMNSIAISPDGRWAAAGGWNHGVVYLWDLPRRKFERVLPRDDTEAGGHTLPAFSPDGRWLVYTSSSFAVSSLGAASGYYFWEVGTWKRGPSIPMLASAGWGEPVFSPDGAMFAWSTPHSGSGFPRMEQFPYWTTPHSG